MSTFTKLVLLTWVVTAVPALAQEKSDLLKDAQQRAELKAQKLEAEVNDCLADAAKLAKTDPTAAAQNLRKVLVVVSDDLTMSAKRRGALLKTLQGKIEKYESAIAVKKFEKPAEPRSRPRTEDSRRSDEGAPRDPRGDSDDPAARTASERIARANKTISENDRIRRERNENFEKDQRNLEAGNTLPVKDLNFPSNWKEIAKKRTKGPKLTEKEAAIMEALRTPITIKAGEMSKQPLEDVLSYFSKKYHIAINLDKSALEAAGIAADSQVTVEANEVTLRTILRKVLADVGLTYIVKSEAIQVMTPERAANEMTIRTYGVADLIGYTNLNAGGILTALQMQQNIQNLISLITSTIEPQSWEINGQGGKGTISFYAPTLSLVIKQTAELHTVLGSGLK